MADATVCSSEALQKDKIDKCSKTTEDFGMNNGVSDEIAGIHVTSMEVTETGQSISSDDKIVDEAKADETVQDVAKEVESTQEATCSTGGEHVEDNTEKNGAEGTSESLDEYEYTKRGDFTSELFKINITNLHKWCRFKDVRKRMHFMDLKPVKIKMWNENCYITFSNEKERVEALKKINGHKWRGIFLKAVKALPMADPLVRKRKEEMESEGASSAKRAKLEDLPESERLKNSTTPLWNEPYEKQLEIKATKIANILKNFMQTLGKNSPDLKPWMRQQRQKYHGLCELEKIIPSPLTEGYRNKCEFTIGPGLDGKESVVGFRLGNYAQGSVHVSSPEEISFVPESMKKVVKSFQSYLDAAQTKGFNPETHTGHWRQLALRTSRLGHVMAMVDFHPQTLTEEEVEGEMTKLKDYFLSGDGSSAGVTNLFYRTNDGKATSSIPEEPYKLLFGDPHITESLLGMKFRISPHAFFQVNTPGAELLYTKIAQWCNTSPETVVLDICCGTGTIGQTVAKSVGKVIGIELNADAVEDAKVNAELNDISNVEYHCSKAEDIIGQLTRPLQRNTDVVAIVDPPRGGLHSSVIVTIRNCPSIKHLIYVSCNASGAVDNFLDLMRPMSKRLKGPRFYPVKGVPIDLFPSTKHFEVVMLFEREREEYGWNMQGFQTGWNMQGFQNF